MESFLDIILEEEQSNRNIEVQNSSMWLIDKDVIQPTTSIKITNKLCSFSMCIKILMKLNTIIT